MCSNNRNGICGGRNAIAYDSDNCGCANNAYSSNNGCVNSAYDSNCGCSNNGCVNNAYDSNCGCSNNGCVNNAYDSNCGCNSCNGGNLLCSAASGFASTVFRVVRGLDRSVSGCGCGNNNGCGCGNNNGCGCGCN